MIVHSDDYVDYCRETATHLRDLHDLAMRGRGMQNITTSVCRRIVQEVGVGPNDDLVDIGCGDGTLLRLANQAGVRSAIGLQATEEEAQLLRDLGLSVRQGVTHDLRLPSASASVVVCNSVLLIVAKKRIPETLAEISRIAKPGARVFLGEIPWRAGPEAAPRLDRAWEMLSYLYCKHGFRTWAGMVHRIVRCKWERKPLVLHDCSSIRFHAEPDEFINMVQSTGLKLLRYWQHEYMNTRNDYLFEKPQAVSTSTTLREVTSAFS